MIYRIFANKKSFKEIEFKKGLNIIVGEKSEDSDNKSTCNGVGKTTLIKIISFCLGSDKDILPINHLKGWEFGIELELYGERITATRPVLEDKISIDGNTENFLLPPTNTLIGKYYTLHDWRIILAKALFNFEKDNNVKYNPTFRSLINYFIRSDKESYNDPFAPIPKQRAVQTQLNNSFFLELNWIDASKAQEIRDEAKTIQELKKIYNEHFLKDFGNKSMKQSKGSLETEKIKLQTTIKRRENELKRFRVNEQYKNFETRANNINNDINKLSEKRIFLNKKLEEYEESVKIEHNNDSSDIEDIYGELGFYFNKSVQKSLEEAKTFHESIIKNRKEFLESEIENIKNQIKKIDSAIKSKDLELSEVMEILNSTMALEKYRLLNNRNNQLKNKLDTVELRIKEIDDINNRENNLKAQKSEFRKIIKRNYEDTKPNWSKAVELFDKNTRALYNEPGSLIIDPLEGGYKFKIEIDRGQSDGISNMQIFCYDLTLLQLFSEKGKIDFLIHDSNIFYGVDERQVALALFHIYKESIKRDIQYICTINYNDVPYKEFKNFEDFKIEDFIVRKLKDNDPSETILGFAFNEFDENTSSKVEE